MTPILNPAHQFLFQLLVKWTPFPNTKNLDIRSLCGIRCTLLFLDGGIPETIIEIKEILPFSQPHQFPGEILGAWCIGSPVTALIASSPEAWKEVISHLGLINTRQTLKCL